MFSTLAGAAETGCEMGDVATVGLAPALTAGESFGRRCAIALVVVAAALILVGPGVIVVDLLWALVNGVEPNVVPEGKPNTLIARYRGLLPLEVPWFAWAVIAAALAVLLSLVWVPTRQYRARALERGVFLNATPYWVALVAVIGLVFTAAASPYYSSGEDWPGLVWIALVTFVAVAVTGFARARFTRPVRRFHTRGLGSS